jgi:cytolysin-activating lysine-acyltransferase
MTKSALPTGSNISDADLANLTQLVKSQVQSIATKIPVLGPVVWLMMQQAGTKHAFLSELEWRVLPALVLDQAKLYMRDGMPLAFVSWARLSDEAAQRYRAAPHRLVPTDWKSGDQVWLADVFTPFGGAAELLKDLRENVFPGQTIHQLGPVSDGLAKVVNWEAIRPPSVMAAATPTRH